ncbi:MULTISPECIES: allantoicase [Nocardiaceae]|jgi:allantoicase|uniref:allantoicase n=1 Tax=Nocardiaceae TaxID=85025 RepID=UPI00050C7AE8|nr:MULTISPECIES: allantoicase [Rhodococcus]MBY4214501.1 allantoicase [Rhodococcus fascians]MBY4238822.1 allantoicase [Rhodococcus fascians]MBY4255437.1 allantoicase [Rhodococcus fascians]MBY4270177.1 allantoicase [Rhodococcus fascians]MDQ0279953.1 allantoicase [Rhodococcus fascians]
MTATFPLPMPDLAVRTLGGAVVWANDETFAEKENLITPGKADYSTATFGHKGQIYDGWETRRRREAGYDEAIVRLGAAGVVSAVIVDTSWFTGNYPPEISIEAAEVTGFPSPTELYDTEWTTIVARSAVDGDSENRFEVASDARWTHVKLSIYPDGGVARLRVLGRGVPDPKFLAVGPVDLAALENGAYVSACSNMFYSSPNNLLFPGPPRSMGEGWETSRRRNDANDWVQVQLAGTGRIRLAELDTSCFLGNAPGAASLQGRLGDGDWIELLPRTTLQPDTRHRFVLDHDAPVSEVRMDIFPDGGMARLRLFGDLAGVEPAE